MADIFIGLVLIVFLSRVHLGNGMDIQVIGEFTQMLTGSVMSNQKDEYLLLNIEIPYNAWIVGYQAYFFKAGSFNFNTWKPTACNPYNQSCARYVWNQFLVHSTIPSRQVTNLLLQSHNSSQVGFQEVRLAAKNYQFAPKGSIFHIRSATNRSIGVCQTSNYSGLICQRSSGTLKSASALANKSLCFNVIITPANISSDVNTITSLDLTSTEAVQATLSQVLALSTTSSEVDTAPLIQSLFGTFKSGLADCLTNCTQGRGLCEVKPNTTDALICTCLEEYYYGSGCQYDIRTCSGANIPCINNSTCVDVKLDSSDYQIDETDSSTLALWTYKCQCQSSLFFGRNCQFSVDLCWNETCSMQGACKSNFTASYCICYTGYYGDQCQFQTDETRKIEKIVSVASVCAIVILTAFYLLFIVMDLLSCREKRRSKPQRNQVGFYRPIYTN